MNPHFLYILYTHWLSHSLAETTDSSVTELWSFQRSFHQTMFLLTVLVQTSSS